MIKQTLKSYVHSWRNTISWSYTSLIRVIPSRFLRISLLRLLGGKIGHHVSMFANVDVRNPSGLIIGEGSSIGPRVLLDARSGLQIDKNVTVAYDAIIWTLHHEMNSVDFHLIGAKVYIGEYAWICSRSIILPGVTIGKGAVVASGSVVTKNVEPYSIVAGVPAKKIGEREHLDFNYIPYFPMHFF